MNALSAKNIDIDSALMNRAASPAITIDLNSPLLKNPNN